MKCPNCACEIGFHTDCCPHCGLLLSNRFSTHAEPKAYQAYPLDRKETPLAQPAFFWLILSALVLMLLAEIMELILLCYALHLF